MKFYSAQSFNRHKLIWLGAGLGLLFLVGDIFIQGYILGAGNLAQQIFAPGPYAVWIRALVISVIVIFTIYAQRMTARLQANRTRLEQELLERQRAESQLNEALTLNRRIIETSLVGMLIYRADSGQCVMANEAAAQAVGASIEQLRGQNFREIESWKTSRLLAVAEQVLNDGNDRRMDVHITTTFGKELWLDGMLSRITPSGAPHLLLMLVDITERKRVEEALRESEERYRAIFDGVRDAIFVEQLTGEIVDVNASACEMYRDRRENLLAKKASDLVPPGHFNLRPNTVQGPAGFDRPVGTVNWRADGESFPVEISCREQVIGGDTLLLVVVRDLTERKQLEQERALLVDTITASLNEIYLFDARTLRFKFVNQGALNNLGYSLAEIQQRTPLDLKPDYTPESFQQLLAPLLRHEQPIQIFKTVHRRADGSLYPIEVHLQLFEHDLESVFLAVIQDITERNRVEEALQASEEKFSRAFRRAPLLMTISSIDDGVYIDVNDKFVEVTGFSREEAIGKSFVELGWIASEAGQRLLGILQAEGRVTQMELAFLTKARRPAQCLYNGELITIGQRQFFLSIVQDITEQQQADETLKRRAAQLTLLADVGGKIAATLELKSVLNRAADLVQRYFGYHHVALFTMDREQHELVMRARAGIFAHLFPIDHRIKLGEGIVGWTGSHGHRLLANDVRSESHYINRYPDRIPTQAELCVPIRVGAEIVGVLDVQSPQLNAFDENDVMVLEALANQIAIAIENSRLYEAIRQELAARQRAEAELLHAKEAAETAAANAVAANGAKSVFLANMSHELRTPLNAILGFSDLMVRDTQLSAEQRENLTIINHSGAHLLNLINDVLDMVKIESGQVTLQEEPFDLHRLLEGLVDMFYLRAVNKGLTLIVDRAPDVPRYVQADQGKLRQVLINLLGNAVKFTAKGGIGLRIRQAGSAGTTCHLEFEVQDTGPGIDPSELEAVFDPFVQLADGVKSQNGSGLGLSISRQFARLMGGDLTASSVHLPGLGALFKFTIPVNLSNVVELPRDAQPTGPTATGLQPGQPTYRLLVVEDHEASRKLMVKLLTQLGFEVRAATNGLEGINIWREWQPHLIWMDIRMPVMDGREATHRIKATPEGQATVIIALTASAFEDERALILSEGCDDYIRKPFRADEIANKLVMYLGVRVVYEPVAATTPARQLGSLKTPDLSGLPTEWVADLQQAVIESDSNQVLRLIGQVRERRPALATALTDLANDFDYGAILDAIQRVEGLNEHVAREKSTR